MLVNSLSLILVTKRSLILLILFNLNFCWLCKFGYIYIDIYILCVSRELLSANFEH